MSHPFRLILACAVACLASCAPSKPPRTTEAARREVVARLASSAEPSILFIGNSYSFGVPRALRAEAAKRGRALHAGLLAESGWTLAKHAADPATTTMLRQRRWDVVVLQEQSRIPCNPWRRAFSMRPAVKDLAARVREAGAVPVLYQTWGRRDRFETMNSGVREGYHQISRSQGGMLVVPVGDAWENEVAAGRKPMLFLPDGSHPSPYGNTITARTFARVFWD